MESSEERVLAEEEWVSGFDWEELLDKGLKTLLRHLNVILGYKNRRELPEANDVQGLINHFLQRNNGLVLVVFVPVKARLWLWLWVTVVPYTKLRTCLPQDSEPRSELSSSEGSSVVSAYPGNEKSYSPGAPGGDSGISHSRTSSSKYSCRRVLSQSHQSCNDPASIEFCILSGNGIQT